MGFGVTVLLEKCMWPKDINLNISIVDVTANSPWVHLYLTTLEKRFPNFSIPWFIQMCKGGKREKIEILRWPSEIASKLVWP